MAGLLSQGINGPKRGLTMGLSSKRQSVTRKCIFGRGTVTSCRTVEYPRSTALPHCSSFNLQLDLAEAPLLGPILEITEI